MSSPYFNQSGAGGGGQAGSAGAKNYLGTVNNVNGNGDFELGTTLKWALGITGTLTNGIPTGTPTFGSGASGNLSISAVNSGQLAGTWSMSYASSAATTAGNMVASDAFTIDLEDQAKVMTVKFYYKAQTNPTNANWSGTSSNSYAWAIYDVTNSAWVGAAGVFGMTQSSGVGYVTGTFQTSSNGTQYRLVVYNANATSGACTIYLDDFFLGPQTAPIGFVGSDWTAYTPTFTGLGTVASVDFRWRRIGSSVQVTGSVTAGTVSGSPATVTLPAGLSVDLGIGSQVKIFGRWATNSTTTANYKDMTVIANNTSGNAMGLSVVDYSSTLSALSTQNGNALIASSLVLSFDFTVPIAGWSSNVQLSNDTDTRVVSFGGYSVATTSFTGSTITIGFTAQRDTAAGWSTNTYTIPVSGMYVIDSIVPVNNTGTAGNSLLAIFKNGVQQTMTYGTPAALTVLIQSVSWTDYYNAGDTIQIRITSAVGTGMSLLGSGVGGNQTTLSINRLSGPAVIAATEAVYFSGQSAATTAYTGTTITMAYTKVTDSHNAWSTNTFTIPVSGTYKIAAVTPYNNTGTIANSLMHIFKNGSSQFNWYTVPVASLAGIQSGDWIDRYNAGDTIQLRMQSSSGTAISLTGSAIAGNQATLTIFRIGS